MMATGASLLLVLARSVLSTKDDNGNNMPVLLKNVLYVPGIRVNLISISNFQAGGLATLFAGEGAHITLPDGQLHSCGSLPKNELFDFEGTSFMAAHIGTTFAATLDTWHSRFSHHSTHAIQKAASDGLLASGHFLPLACGP